MQQQLATAREAAEIGPGKRWQVMTGDRGMARLLAGTDAHYFASNWTQVTSAGQGQGSSGYPGLAADVQSAIAAMPCCPTASWRPSRRLISGRFNPRANGALMAAGSGHEGTREYK